MNADEFTKLLATLPRPMTHGEIGSAVGASLGRGMVRIADELIRRNQSGRIFYDHVEGRDAIAVFDESGDVLGFTVVPYPWGEFASVEFLMLGGKPCQL